MDEWTKWTEPLRKKLHALKNPPFTDRTDEQRFFEVELCLRLHERVVPHESCLDTWTLLTGYPMAGINDAQEAWTMCQIARRRAYYLRTDTSWKLWLDKYGEQPAWLRLYDVNLQTGTSTRRPFLGILPERLPLYDEALEWAAAPRKQNIAWAQAGREYTYMVDDTEYRVRIPDSFVSSPLSTPTTGSGSARTHDPIQISVDELAQVAEEMDRYDPDGHWKKRVDDLNMALVEDQHLVMGAHHFTLDRIFHLVGLVSSGKSTWIQVLTYYLVKKRQLHVSLLLNTVSESIAMAAAFHRLGIAAAPITGRNRAAHRLKYGQSHSTELLPEDLFQPNAATQPALDWLSAPCAISGLTQSGGAIPAGKEPCTGLRDNKGEYHTCPLLDRCPVHQAEQDLAEASVWIATPWSFLYTRAPHATTLFDQRALELIYRRSDVFFIDEADRAQAQFDQMYAPVNDLVGHPDALLDWTDPAMAQEFQHHRGRLVRDRRYKYLKMLIGETSRFANNVYSLLLNHKDLADWVADRPLSITSIIDLLAKDLATAPDGTLDDALMQRLLEALQGYAGNPTKPEKAFDLASFVDSVHYEDEGPLMPQLENWLEEQQLPWSIATHPKRISLLLKLEMALWLIAMDDRVYKFVQTWMHTSTNLEDRLLLDQSPPREYEHIVPESPFGNRIGYQLGRRGRDGGVLQYLQCRGIGRWILLHFHHLYQDIDGSRGPTVVLTAATSWAPGSAQFHIHQDVNAVLFPPRTEREAIEQSVFAFLPVPGQDGKNIRVSGTYGEGGQDLFANLEKVVRYLAADTPTGPSLIERELTHWRDQGIPRRVALLVGSYPQCRHVQAVLQTIPSMRNRSIIMLPDAEGDTEARFQLDAQGIIYRGEIERLREKEADILIVPWLAFQRGYNVLDVLGGALLGSAFFLVRPYPHPDDASLPIIGVNSDTIAMLKAQNWVLPSSLGATSRERIGALRHTAYSNWMKRLYAQKSEYGMQGMKDPLYAQFLWDQFVLIDQTGGRFVRGGRPARVFFVDASFHPERGRSMLLGWLHILEEYLGPQSTKPLLECQLADALYGPFYRALRHIEL